MLKLFHTKFKFKLEIYLVIKLGTLKVKTRLNLA